MLTGFRDFDRTWRALDLLRAQMDRAVPQEGRREVAGRGAVPLANLYEDKAGFVLEVELPGFSEADVKVLVENDVLVLRGARKAEAPAGFTAVHSERPPIVFNRSFSLSAPIDGEAVSATMKDGILTVTLPKSKEALPRQIAVKSLA